MKKPPIWVVVVVVVAAAVMGGFLAGRLSSGIQRVSGSEFLRHADPPQVNSAYSARLIGVTDERAYLEYWSALRFWGTEHTVIWTPLSELPADVAQKLSEGTNPWP